MQNLYLCASALVMGALVACSSQTDGSGSGTSAGIGGGNGTNVGGGKAANLGGGANANLGGGANANLGGGANATSTTGTTDPNCVPMADCAATGKNCGPVSDGCNGLLQCGTCTAPECCGCSGVPSVCGAGGSSPPSVSQTCIAGTIGCLCDSAGGCAPGLTCTAQTGANPRLCCSGADCTPPAGGSIGASCGATTSTATCVPGVTVPVATGNNDNCGYLATSFAESVIMCAIQAQGGGSAPAQIQAFYNDEWPLTLGCGTGSSTTPVAARPSTPTSVFYPQTGDPRCVDTAGRPMRPSLFITDITGDPNCRAGDQQQSGKAYDPVAIFGVWTDATMAANLTGTPIRNAPALTYWNLGTSADAVPPAATAACPCTAGSCVTTGHTGRGFGAEVRYEAGLISGHSYRLQVQMHDGDQTQGGDAGEACVIFCAGTGSCTPKTCADYPDACGQQPDGCGGLTPVCNECCPPTSCETVCAPLVSGAGARCQTSYDTSNGMILSCNPPDNCGGFISCWCPVG